MQKNGPNEIRFNHVTEDQDGVPVKWLRWKEVGFLTFEVDSKTTVNARWFCGVLRIDV